MRLSTAPYVLCARQCMYQRLYWCMALGLDSETLEPSDCVSGCRQYPSHSSVGCRRLRATALVRQRCCWIEGSPERCSQRWSSESRLTYRRTSAHRIPIISGRMCTYCLLFFFGMVHECPSAAQFEHGSPSWTTSHLTFRMRHPTQALEALFFLGQATPVCTASAASGPA